MKRPYLVILLAALCAFDTGALAVQQPSSRDTISSEDARELFSNSGQFEALLLSEKELRETRGAVAPVVAIGLQGLAGAALGAGGYLNGVRNGSYPFSGARLAGNTASGAVFGATFGAAGTLAGGGLTAGANIWRANSLAANAGANQIWRQTCAGKRIGSC